MGFARFGLRRLRGREELGELTKDELYRRAQRADIAGRSEMTKDELVDALRGS